MSDDENTYEDHIQVEPVTPEVEPPYEVAEIEAVAPQIVKTGPGWKTVILTGFVAGLVGAGAGAAALYTLVPKVLGTDTAQITTLERQVEAKLSTLDTRLKAAETTASAPSGAVEFDATDLEARLSTLETAQDDGLSDRVDALEAQPRPEIDPDALSALQAAQADGFEWPDTKLIDAALTRVDERLSALEADAERETDDPALVEALERLEQLEASQADLRTPDELVARLEALESRAPVTTVPDGLMDRLSALESAPAPVAEPRFVLAFPKAEMLRAVESNREGGFMERTLSKHIRVKSEDDPTTLINGITADITAGDLDAAARKFERLPKPIQAPGQAWYASVKDTK